MTTGEGGLGGVKGGGLAGVRAKAEAATPGPWGNGCFPGVDPRDNRIYATTVRDEVRGRLWTRVFEGDSSFDDAEFVATFDPPTVKALLDVLEAVGSYRQAPRGSPAASGLGRARMFSAVDRAYEALGVER